MAFYNFFQKIVLKVTIICKKRCFERLIMKKLLLLSLTFISYAHAAEIKVKDEVGISTKNSAGDIPLHMALKTRQFGIAKKLIPFTYSDLQDNDGNTSFHLADTYFTGNQRSDLLGMIGNALVSEKNDENTFFAIANNKGITILTIFLKLAEEHGFYKKEDELNKTNKN